MDNRSIESTVLGNEIWQMSLDMGFGVDGCNIAKSSSDHKTYSRDHAPINYNDVPNMLFQRLDDFKDDIFQITDLTNSLHKGNAESAQVVLNKMASQEIGDLSNMDCLQTEHMMSNFAQSSNLKNIYSPKDVYGKISHYNGKLLLQLRVIQENTHHFLNISECWICQERMDINSTGNCHRHGIHASFTSNAEFVQFEIDHFRSPNPEANMNFTGQKSRFSQNSGVQVTNETDIASKMEVFHGNSMDHGKHSNVHEYQEMRDHYGGKSNDDTLPVDSDKSFDTSTTVPIVALSNPNSTVNISRALANASGTNAESKPEVGAKKRKSRTQKKSTVIGIKDVVCPSNVSESCSVLPEAFPIPKACTSKISDTIEISVNPKKLSKKKTVQLACYVCSKAFKCTSIYKSHVLSHGISPQELFSCSYCSQKFGSLKLLSQHLKAHRSKKATCTLCGVTYSGLSKLQRHMNAFHFQKRKFQCKICSAKFFRSEYLKKHMNIHNDKRFKCDICNSTCSTKYNLDEHKKLHLSQKISCDICSQSFPRKFYLDRHKTKEHSNKKLECDICNKCFSRTDVLKRHKRIHELVPQKFGCEVCQKQFSRKDKLYDHIRTHESTPTNLCPYCPATFKKKDIYKKHLAIHKSKEQCNICYKFLSTAARLQSHLRWHERQIKINFERKYLNSFNCEKCLKSFTTTELLVRHVSRVHNAETQKKDPPVERPKKFFCELCPKGFTRSCNLKAHLKTHKTNYNEESVDESTPLKVSKAKKITTYSDERDTAVVEQPQRIFLDFEANKYHQFPYPPMFVPPVPEDSSLHYPSYSYGSFSSDVHIPPVNLASSPSSPINLSTEAITAAAYLLAHPSYPQ